MIDSMTMTAVVTGLGVVSPFGSGVEAFRNGLREGRSAASRPALARQARTAARRRSAGARSAAAQKAARTRRKR